MEFIEMAKRDIFGELMTGIKEMAEHRKGKLTVRSYKVKRRKLPKVSRVGAEMQGISTRTVPTRPVTDGMKRK